MSFLDTLAELWRRPAIDTSSAVATENFYKLIVEADQRYKAKVDATIIGLGYSKQYTSLYGFKWVKNKPTIYGDPIKTESGLVSYDKKAKENSIDTRIDASDSIDYKMRFKTIDAKIEYEDGGNIAFMRIVNSKTKETYFPNKITSHNGITETKFKQFILTQLTVASQERMQIVETSTKNQVLFFGHKPEVLQLNGILKNTEDNPWTANMIFLWDDLMCGTKLVEKQRILQIYADGELFTGYPFAFQRSKMAPNDFLVSFSFSFLIKERVQAYTDRINPHDNDPETGSNNIEEDYYDPETGSDIESETDFSQEARSSALDFVAAST